MTIRLIVRHTDTSNMSPHGGTHVTTYKTIDVDIPELDVMLRGNGQYAQHQLVGAELLHGTERPSFTYRDLLDVADFLDPKEVGQVDPDIAQRVGKWLRKLARGEG